MSLRKDIYQEIEGINTLDLLEKDHQQDALAWIESGADIFRIKKHATPPKHLVSYFVVVDGDYILLVDHKKAQLWLPTGGHVDPNENPRVTVSRESLEELKLKAEFLIEQPLMVTITKTVGLTAGHTDVSLWYIIKGDRNQQLDYDEGEFHSIKWFNINDVPLDKADPHMARFIEKLKDLKL